MRKIAALFVEYNGNYFGLPGIEPYCIFRNAKNYKGPHRVIAHPPCERWGRYWGGGPSAKVKRVLGDDGGCFESALASVRKYGGVLEHPEASHAWKAFGLSKPPREGGWIKADAYGYTCCVEQGHYGHKARKATWLYVVGLDKLPELRWGASEGVRIDEGFHSSEERRAKRELGVEPAKRLSVQERVATPIEFRDLLIALVRG